MADAPKVQEIVMWVQNLPHVWLFKEGITQSSTGLPLTPRSTWPPMIKAVIFCLLPATSDSSSCKTEFNLDKSWHSPAYRDMTDGILKLIFSLHFHTHKKDIPSIFSPLNVYSVVPKEKEKIIIQWFPLAKDIKVKHSAPSDVVCIYCKWIN